MSSYEKAYNRLNPEQKKAVDTIDGPVMVVAGPGTGKTQILTLRIANILQKTQTNPNSILALTFTDTGVKAMRERLVEFIGSTGYKVDIFTFHSFCKRVIDDNPESFELGGDMMILSDLERVEIFKKILDESDLLILKPKNSPYYHIQNISSKLNDLKREGISPEDFEKIVEEERANLKEEDHLNKRTGKPKASYFTELKKHDKYSELVFMYYEYQKRLKVIKRYDYEDLITYTVQALKDDDMLLAKYQERYQYILSDEYQDTNSAQNDVIQLLTSFEFIEKPNVFVVGDDEQSIYRFQGASLENFLFFEDQYPELEKISLRTNYRSTQTILDASRVLISNNENKLVDKDLESFESGDDKKINIIGTSHEIIEKYFLASKLKELIDNGVTPSEIAVLYRTNREGDELSKTLSKFDIKTQTTKGENLLDDPEIKKLIKILQVVLENEPELRKQVDDKFFWTGQRSDKDINLFTVMHYEFFGIAHSDILKLIGYASQKKKNIEKVLNNELYLDELSLETRDKVEIFWSNINKWKSDAFNQPFVKFLEIVIHESAMVNEFLDSEDRVDKLNKLNRFFSELKNFNYSNQNLSLSDFFNTLALRRDNNISIQVSDIKVEKDAVQLMTAHGAKGLEYEYVFVLNCTDGNWGNKRVVEHIPLPQGVIKLSDVSKLEKNEDERRLFYVAMTRAKKELYLSYAKVYEELGQPKTKLPSIFINEITEDLINYIDAKEYEGSIQKALETMTTVPDQKLHMTVSEEEYLQDSNKFLSISATGLNTYLKCPYKYKLDRIFRIPKVKEIPLAFGTSVHKALEDFYRYYVQNGSYPEVEIALKSFTAELKRQLLSKQDYDELINRGVDILKEYLEEAVKHELNVLATEYDFTGKKAYLDDIKLTGKVDRIDVIDELKREVRVIDYKTGRPKSLNEILGKTKYSDEDYKRQLVFYKLLTQLDDTFNKVVIDSRLEFVEKDQSGKYKNVDYTVSDEDLSDLRQTIRETAVKIKNLEFERTTEFKNCGLCPYREHCWPDGIPESYDSADTYFAEQDTED